MKKLLSGFLMMAVIVCLITATAITASAAEIATQDGIEVCIATDKDSYTSTDDINVTVSVKNTNTYDVNDVNVTVELPEGLSLKSGTLSVNDVDIKAGETYTKNVIAVKAASTSEDQKQEDNPTKTEEDNKQTSPQTGDDSHLILWIILLAFSAAGIVLSFKYRKKATKVLSLFLCVAMLVAVVPLGAIAADNNNCNIEVDKIVNVDSKAYKITASVSFNNGNTFIPSDDPNTFTRGEWIALLADKFEIMPINIEDDYICHFGDSKSSEYGAISETFYALGILPVCDASEYLDPEQDIPLFEANKVVTREYAAYTVAKIMGYTGEYSYNYTDVSSVTYKNEVAVMLQLEYMMLNNSKFEPSNPLIGTDKNRIFHMIDLTQESLLVKDGEEKSEVTYQDDVIVLENVIYSIDKTDGYILTVEKNGDTEKIKSGSVLMLPANEQFVSGIALKAISVQNNSNNYIIKCEEPQIEEVIKSLDFAGHGNANIDNMILDEGVTAEYDPNGVIVDFEDENLSPFDVGGSTALPGKLKFNIAKKKIGSTGVTVSGDFECSIPDITVKAKGKVLGGFTLDELTATITSKLKIKGSVKYDFGVPESGYDISTGNPTFGTGKTELGRLPIALGPTGLSLDFVIFLNLDVSGKASISYTIENTNGFQYKNGAFRLIKDYTSDFNLLELNATVKFGVGIAARISLFSVFDLAGIDAHAGIGVTAKFVVHTDVDPNLYCGDGSVYLYATLELDDDTFIVEILKDKFHISWSWDIFNESNSPLKKGIHLENAKIVDSCTYGKGQIFGSVKDAQTGAAIAGAQVKVYNSTTGNLIKTVSTERVSLILSGVQLYKGEFLVENLPVGKYRLEIRATGYQYCFVDVEVKKGQRNVCEATMMILRDDIEGDGQITGSIIDAMTGNSLTETSYCVRKGWNIYDGECVSEGNIPGSNYTIQLPAGNYTIQISKTNYIAGYANVTIQSNYTAIKDITLTPTDISGFRVVLTWGSQPKDLDSHLYNYGGDTVFHTWYSDKDYYASIDLDYNELYEMIANLDVDDIDSYGPETSTVYYLDENGSYSFYVHDYTNRDSSSSTQLSNSGAQVKLYFGETLVETFNIPQGREGTLWHVFDYDATTNEVNFVNSFSYANAG